MVEKRSAVHVTTAGKKLSASLSECECRQGTIYQLDECNPYQDLTCTDEVPQQSGMASWSGTAPGGCTYSSFPQLLTSNVVQSSFCMRRALNTYSILLHRAHRKGAAASVIDTRLQSIPKSPSHSISDSSYVMHIPLHRRPRAILAAVSQF